MNTWMPFKPFVSRQVAAMLEVMQLTGARPREITIMRGRDLDMSGPVWIFQPEFHRNDMRGKSQEICLGPKAQEVVKPFLRPALDEYLFNPADAETERYGKCKVHRHQPIGSMWMVRGQQAQVETPGTNQKRYLAGSLNWRTGD